MVIAEALSIVVRRSTLEEKYPGGFEGYRNACPNQTFCADDHLTRVGFQTPGDVAGWRVHLETLGFLIVDGDGFVDFAIVDQRTGPTAPCDWLVWSRGRRPAISRIPSAGPRSCRPRSASSATATSVAGWSRWRATKGSRCTSIPTGAGRCTLAGRSPRRRPSRSPMIQRRMPSRES